LKVLFLNPPVLTVQEPWYDEPDFVRTSLAFLAAYLRDKDAFVIYCLDAKFERLNFEKTIERISEINPDVIGFTAFTNEIKPAAYVAAKAKMILPNVINVIGGAHITALPSVTLKEFPSFDVGVFGEGEITFLELCRALRCKTDLSGIKGVCYRRGKDILINSPRDRSLNLDSFPMPAWDLFPPANTYHIQTIRGCPFNCVFCMNHNGKVARKNSVQRVIDELNFLIDYGAKQISFGDELFSVDMVRTHDLLNEMIKHNIGQRVKWDVQTHVAYVDDELLAKMKEANIDRIEMGVETGDEAALKRMGKATNPEMIKKAFRLAHKHKIKTGSFLLIGQPNESLSSICKTIKLGIKINPSEPIIGTMVPYPGTEVSKMAAEGKGGFQLLTYDWDAYSKQINYSLAFNNISLNTIKLAQFLGYFSIFIFNLRFFDLIKFLIKYNVAGFNLLFSFFKRKTSLSKSKPLDYDELTSGFFQVTGQDILNARMNWKKTQVEEIKKTKESNPALLEEQKPVVKYLDS
jgi:anaerobic magnesium-protoporphyrin IX monomethyl ester cyclase